MELEHIMKISKKRIFIGFFIALIVIVFFLLRNVFLWEEMFKNNSFITSGENRAIKQVVLSAVKDRCSKLFNIDPSDLYKIDSKYSNIQLESPNVSGKSLFCLIDPYFMNTLEITDSGMYHVIVKVNYPESYYYHISLIKDNDDYIIVLFELDI